MLPHADKKHKGGEDAFVVLDTMLSVCDGVGGWATQGVDPADFSRALAANVEGIYMENIKNPKIDLPSNVIGKPRELLVQAVEKTK